MANHEIQASDNNTVLSEFEDLRRELVALRSEYEKAVSDKRDVFLQLQKVQLQVNEWETNYNVLKEDNQRLKRENTDLKTSYEFVKTQKQVAVSEHVKAEYDGHRERLTNEIASLNAKIASMKEAYEYVQLEKSTLEEKVIILQKTISSLENTNESLLMEKHRLQQDMDSTRREREGSIRVHDYSTVHHSFSGSSDYDSLKAKYDEVCREKYSLEYQLRVAKEKTTELENRLKTESGRVEKRHYLVSQNSFSKLEEDYNQLMHDKRMVESEIDIKHRRELEENQTLIYKLEQELREMRTEKARYDELYKENEYLIKERFNLENELRITKEKIVEVESSRINETRMEKELVAFKDKYTSLEKDYSTLMQDKRKFEAELYIQVRKEVDEKQGQIFKLEREIHELRADKARYDDVCREKEFLIKERSNMENELRIAREKTLEFESRSMIESRTEQELVIYKDKCTQLEKEYGQMLQERRRLETDFHIQVRKEVEEKQAHIYQLESEMRELRMNSARYEDVFKEKEFLLKERYNLENEHRAARQKIAELESRSMMEGRLENELAAFKEKYTKLESDYSTMVQEKRRLEAEFHIQVRKEIEEKQSQIYKLEAEMHELRMDKGRYDDLYKEKEFLIKEKFDLESELRTTREKIMEFESRSMLESRTEKELVIYQDKYTQLEKEYSVLMQDRRRFEADLHIQVRKEVEEKQAHIYKIERELHDLQIDKARYDDLYKEKEFLIKERLDLENELRIAREKIIEFESHSMMGARMEKELTLTQERYAKLEKDYSLLMQEKRRMEADYHVQARKEVEEKESHIYKLEMELRELRMNKGRYDDLYKEKEFLVKEKFDLESELRITREKIVEFESRSMLENRIEKELVIYQDKYTQLEKEYSGLMQERRRLEADAEIRVRKEVEEKQSHIYRLEQEIREMKIEKNRYDDLYKEKEFLLKERYNLENELRITREKIIEFESRSMVEAKTERNLVLYQEKYSNLEKDFSLLMQEKRKLETDGEIRVRKEVEEKQSHIYRLEQEIREMKIEKNRYDDLYKEKEFLLKERYNLENELRITREKIIEFESRSMVEAKTERNLVLYQEKYSNLEKDFSLLMQEKRKLETDGEIRVRKEVEEKLSHIYKLEHEILALKSEKERYDEVCREKEFLVKERYNLEIELRNTREKMLEFETRLKTDSTRLEQEMAVFKNRYTKLEGDYNFLVEEKKKLEEDIEIRVKKEFWEKQESVYKLEKEIRELRSENEYYQKTVEEKNASISDMRVSVSDLQRKVESLKKELFVAEEAYEKAEMKLKEVLKSEYKPVTTYVVRRTLRTVSDASQHSTSSGVTKTTADEGPLISSEFGATSTPNVERKSEARGAVGTASVLAKTIDFNTNVEEVGKKTTANEADEATKDGFVTKEGASEGASSSFYSRSGYSSAASPRTGSMRYGPRVASKYSSGYGGSTYSAGSSYRTRPSASTRNLSTRKYY